MSETENSLIPIFSFFASTTGSGAVTTWLFDYLKARWPMHDGAIWIVRWLHTPRWARLLSVLLGMAISVLFTVLLALITGKDIWNAVDLALAPTVSALFSQFLHAARLPGTPTYPEPMLGDQPLTSWAAHKPPELRPGYSAAEAEDDYRRDVADAQQRYQNRLLDIHQSTQPPAEDEV